MVCEHIGSSVYARRVLSDGTTHHCIQCLKCLGVVKSPRHGNRPYIRLEEIPTGKRIHDFIEPEALL